MRLYRVEVTVEVVVLAEDHDAAAGLAERHLVDEVHNADLRVTEIRHVDHLGAWKKALPWGGDGKSTCAQYMEPKP